MMALNKTVMYKRNDINILFFKTVKSIVNSNRNILHNLFTVLLLLAISHTQKYVTQDY